jgi:hypothetical protein
MIRGLRIVFFLVTATLTLAQNEQAWQEIHKQDETSWAVHTGLSPLTVHQLWRLASHFAEAANDDSRIQLLDAGSLGRNHIVLVTYAGSEYCLSLTVFAKTRGYEKIWTEDETPDGAGFCGADAKVWVSDGKIVVSTPTSLTGSKASAPNSLSTLTNGTERPTDSPANGKCTTRSRSR